MTTFVHPVEIDKAIALGWLRRSLGRGEVISPAALKFIAERDGRGWALVPETVDRALLSNPDSGAVITGDTGSPREALGRVLTMLAERGAACVVVENDLRLKRDPEPRQGDTLLTGYVGEKVIHWAQLADGPADAVCTIYRGASGYPTNAFVTSASAEALGLSDGADVDPDVADHVVESLLAVITAAYDAETYIIWEPS
jgi:hypothetical protein